MVYAKPKFLNFFIPSLIFLGLTFLFHETSLDENIASLFYSPTSQWIYRNSFFLEKILHKGGVLFSMAVLLGFVGYWVYLLIKKPNERRHGDYVGFIVISSLVTILTVYFIKKVSTLPCPWDSTIFGGGSLRPALWQMFSSKYSSAHCFPGGHSSAGYAFLSIYFGHTFIYGKRSLFTLVPGVLIGILFGLAQQLRGAHFMSHDMATIFIGIVASWVTSWLYFFYYDKNEV